MMTCAHVLYETVGGACRARVTAKLSHNFVNPKEAERFYLECDETSSACGSGSGSGSKTESKLSPADSKSSSSSELPSASFLSSISSASKKVSVTNIAKSSLHTCKLITVVSGYFHACLHPHASSVDKSVLQHADEIVGITQEMNSQYLDYSAITIEHVDTVATIMERLGRLDGEQLLVVIGELFSKVAEEQQVYVSTDFLPLSLSAMKQLSTCGRSNILYGLARGLGTIRADTSDSLFPSNKLITGLFEYSVGFFNAGDNAQHVSIRQQNLHSQSIIFLVYFQGCLS